MVTLYQRSFLMGRGTVPEFAALLLLKRRLRSHSLTMATSPLLNSNTFVRLILSSVPYLAKPMMLVLGTDQSSFVAASSLSDHRSFVRLPKPESEYYSEAIDRFRALCSDRKLVATVDHKEGHLLHLRLIDPTDPHAAEDPFACINTDLLREGLASIDRKDCKYLSAYPQLVKRLQEVVNCAKRDRYGMFEFGDIEDE